MKIARVALDVPLDQAFDFAVPEGLDPPRGSLVVVPFGRSSKVGVVVARPGRTEVPAERLREIARQVEDLAPLAERDFELLEFCASYYQRPLGETLHASLPPRLRQASRRALKPPEATEPPRGPFASPIEATAEQSAAVERVSAGNRIRVSHGLRLGSDMEHPRGEYLLFPLELCATGREIDLNPLFASKTPKEAVDIMRAICPNSVCRPVAKTTARPRPATTEVPASRMLRASVWCSSDDGDATQP